MKWAYLLPATIPLVSGNSALRPVLRDQASIGALVNARNGLIQGAASDLRLEVSTYLGIPFAQPPVGGLRFAAPVAAETYQGVLNATSFVSHFITLRW